MRVGHRPLFRGEPGYQVFKHLQCAVFTEKIACAEGVAGYECLRDEDYYALAKRVNESFTEIQKEKEELDADELVQKRFEGALRPRPKGLVANLLPFQVEGLSWMYNQEKNEKDVRGGILADEMVSMESWRKSTAYTLPMMFLNMYSFRKCRVWGKRFRRLQQYWITVQGCKDVCLAENTHHAQMMKERKLMPRKFYGNKLLRIGNMR